MKKPLLCFVLLFVMVISLGCANQMQFPKPVTLDRTARDIKVITPGDTSAPEKAGTGYERLQMPEFKKTEPPKTLPARTVIDPKLIKMFEGPVTINVENMPLSDFIIYALGETLKIPFVMDEKVMKNKKPVSMRMPQAMPSNQALELITGLFEKNNLYMEEKVGALYILSEPPADSKQLFDIKFGWDTADSSAYVLQVIPLRHVKPGDLIPLIKDILKTDIKIQSSNKENVLLFHGPSYQVRQILSIVDTFDVPYLQGKNLFLLRLTYWQPEEFIKELTKLLKGLGFSIASTSSDPGPLFMPIKQLNAVLLVAPDEKTAKYILDWKDKLDTPEAAGDAETAFSYRPRYSRASDLVESIKTLYGFTESAPGGKPTTPAAASESRSRSAATARPATQSGTSGSTAADTNVFGMSGLKMAADNTKNVIIIMSSAATYKTILTFLQELDTPPRQVLIEATFAELTLTDDLKYGFEWYIRNTLHGGPYSVSQANPVTSSLLGGIGTALSASAPAGLAFQFLSKTENIKAVVNALATADKAKFLSTPRLVVLDNKEATIQVGDEVPTVTAQMTSSEATVVTSSIQYRTTGVILKVRPTINSEGLLTLDISQEVSEAGKSGAGNSPIIFSRSINTSVVVAHGQTIALGGLIKEYDSTGESKIPLLGDIPILGHLFKNTTKGKQKTELLVLVTPTILVSTDDATKITDELKKELKWIK